MEKVNFSSSFNNTHIGFFFNKTQNDTSNMENYLTEDISSKCLDYFEEIVSLFLIILFGVLVIAKTLLKALKHQTSDPVNCDLDLGTLPPFARREVGSINA